MLGAILIIETVVAVLLIAVPWVVILVIPFILVLFLPIFIASIGVYLLNSAFSTWRERKALSVLIVDDDAISVLPLVNVLSEKLTHFEFVKSGQQMIDALKAKKFDLVFLDQMMPGVRGDEALKLGESQALASEKTSVVFFSNFAGELHLEPYKKFEIKGIWQKHISYLDLSEKVRSIFSELALA